MPQNATQGIWMQAAANAVSSGIGLGVSRLGINYDYRKQLEQQKKLMALQMGGEQEMMKYQLGLTKDSYLANLEGMQKAGLNPGLMYGLGGAGGQSVHGSPPVTGGTAAHVNTSEGMALGLQMGLQNAQMELIKAQTRKTNVEADKTAGVDTKNVEASTEGIRLNNEFLRKSLNDRIDIINTEAAQKIAELDITLGHKDEERMTRIARVDKVINEAAGQILVNNLLGQQAAEIQSKINLNAAEIVKWGQEIAQGWKTLDLKEKELKVMALMKEIEAQYSGIKTVAGTIPNFNTAASIIRQIDHVMGLSKEDFKKGTDKGDKK